MSHEVHLPGVDHPTDHHMTANYTPDMLSCYPGYWNQELESWSSSVVLGSKDSSQGIDMLSDHSMSVVLVVDHV